MKTISLFSLILIFMACQKEEIDLYEERELSVHLDQPSVGDKIGFGKELNIKGEIIGNFELHGYSIELINRSNSDSVLLSMNAHKHGKTIPFSTSWKNELSTNSELVLTVTGYGDHMGYLSDKVEVKLEAKGN